MSEGASLTSMFWGATGGDQQSISDLIDYSFSLEDLGYPRAHCLERAEYWARRGLVTTDLQSHRRLVGVCAIVAYDLASQGDPAGASGYASEAIARLEALVAAGMPGAVLELQELVAALSPLGLAAFVTASTDHPSGWLAQPLPPTQSRLDARR